MDPFLDPRFAQGVELFNKREWYAAHDAFEALWHDTTEPERRWLQGIVQIAVAMVHLERDNHNGALILLGEGCTRLRTAVASPAGWTADAIFRPCKALQQQLSGGTDLVADAADLVPSLFFDSTDLSP